MRDNDGTEKSLTPSPSPEGEGNYWLSGRTAKYINDTCLQVDGTLINSVFYENVFFNIVPFAFVEAFSLCEHNFNTCHQMTMLQGDGTCGRKNALFLCPKEIAGFVARELTTCLQIVTLVLLYAEGIGLCAGQFGIKGVVSVGIYGCFFVFPVYLIAARPSP